jgi:hypothetical protein
MKRSGKLEFKEINHCFIDFDAAALDLDLDLDACDIVAVSAFHFIVGFLRLASLPSYV